jgi:hypothetical protein
MGPLCAGGQFRECLLEDALLGVHETAELEGIIVHPCIMVRTGAMGKSSSRLLVRREQPRQNIEKDHDWPGEQSQRNEAEPDNSRIHTGIIGKTGGDTHDLGIAAVDQETSVHLGFPWFKWPQAIGKDVAAETSRSAEMNAPAIMVAA